MIPNDFRSKMIWYPYENAIINKFGQIEVRMSRDMFEYFTYVNHLKSVNQFDEQLKVEMNYIMEDDVVYGQYWNSQEELENWLHQTKDSY